VEEGCKGFIICKVSFIFVENKEEFTSINSGKAVMGILYPRFLISYPDRIYQKDQYVIHTEEPRLIFKVNCTSHTVKGNLIQSYTLELLDEIANEEMRSRILNISQDAENWFLSKIKSGTIDPAMKISKPSEPATIVTSHKSWQDIQKEILAEREEIFRKYGTSNPTILDECMTPQEKQQLKQLEEDLHTFTTLINLKK
jgi:hypothetical protein